MTGYAGLSDKRAYLQVLGSLLLNPMLMDDVDRQLDSEDFNTEPFYKIVYVAIYNLYQQGVEKIDEYAIDSYLVKFPNEYEIFQSNKGLDWIHDAKDMAILENYDYYYHRVKKFSLLRYYEDSGLNTSNIYDVTKADSIEENQKFDDLTEQDIVDKVENHFVVNPKARFCNMQSVESSQAGMGLDEMIDEYLTVPDYGYSMSSPAGNTLCRGLRCGLYLRSAHTGVGKTRTFIMEAANFAVPYKYDNKQHKFIYTGHCTSTVYIGTEGSLKSFKRILLAAVSGVNEEHILKGEYKDGELEIVRQSSKYISEAPLEMVYIDEFSINDIENLAKKYVLQKDIKILIFDYIQMTTKMMISMTSKAKTKIAEYQVILDFSRRMKQLSERLGIAILSGMQLRPDTKEARYKDETCLQSAKAVVQKADVNIILSKPTKAEKQKLEKITRNMMKCPEVNLLQWYSKIRDGSLVSVIVASHIDLGCLYMEDLFVMDYDFNLLPLEFTKIEELKDEEVEQIVKDNSRELKIEDDVQDEDTDSDDDEEEEVLTNAKFNW